MGLPGISLFSPPAGTATVADNHDFKVDKDGEGLKSDSYETSKKKATPKVSVRLTRGNINGSFTFKAKTSQSLDELFNKFKGLNFTNKDITPFYPDGDEDYTARVSIKPFKEVDLGAGKKGYTYSYKAQADLDGTKITLHCAIVISRDSNGDILVQTINPPKGMPIDSNGWGKKISLSHAIVRYSQSGSSIKVNMKAHVGEDMRSIVPTGFGWLVDNEKLVESSLYIVTKALGVNYPIEN
jgi:hypothetical protein